MHKVGRRLIPLVIILALIAAGVWYLIQDGEENIGGSIQASGTIETTEVLVSPELSGRIVEVYVRKGEFVQAGDPLMRLDDEILLAQRERAQTALEAAQANLDAAQTGLALSKAALNTAEANHIAVLASTEAEMVPTHQSLDELYENVGVARAQAVQEVASANRSLREAQYALDNFTTPINQQAFAAMEAVSEMEARLEEARQAFEPYKYRSSSDATREEFKEALDEAQSDYDSAIKRLEYETAVESARTQLESAMRDLEALQDGPDPDAVKKLEAMIAALEATPRQAETAVEQAQISQLQADDALEAAKRTLAQAQAEVDLIDVQIKKLTIDAAAPGVVLSHNIEPGEVVQAGSPSMTIGDLDRLTITVYVPEDRYGQLELGMQAQVTVELVPWGGVYCRNRLHRRPGRIHTPQCTNPRRSPDNSVCG